MLIATFSLLLSISQAETNPVLEFSEPTISSQEVQNDRSPASELKDPAEAVESFIDQD